MSAQDIPHHGPQTVTFTASSLPNATYCPSSRSPSVDYPGEPSAVNGVGTVQTVSYRPNHHDDVLSGVSGVEYDDKVTSAYSSINQFDDKRVNGYVSHISIPKTDIPEKGADAKTVVAIKRTLCCFIFIALLGFFVALAAGGLAAYSLLLSYQNGALISDPHANEMELTLARLTTMVEELNQNLSNVTREHETRYTLLTTQVSQISGSVETIFGTQEENLSASIPSLNELSNISIFEGCTTMRHGQCQPASNILHPEAPPTFGVCETASVALDEPGMRNMNMYCAVTNVDPNQSELNPPISTLNVSGGQVSCSCNLLILSDAFPINGIQCELYITRCPANLEPGLTN